jgi:type III restriction enzyme
MAKKRIDKPDFEFYSYLKLFFEQEKKKIYSSFKPLSKKILHFNSPENPNTWLRKPQFEALEIYIFLKEFLENKYLAEIFQDWFEKNNQFENRQDAGIERSGQMTIFGPIEDHQQEGKELFNEVMAQMKTFQHSYPNYIFALSMGIGKTILMATSIFYEFLLANKYPKNEKYCHNAIVFAPDKTVLQSLKEIETFDKSKVIPTEYVNWLDTNLKFHFLDDSGVSLNAIDKSKYNIIISNTQKIILKKQHKAKSPSASLFADYSTMYRAKAVNKDYEDLYGFEINTDQDLLMNQRFAKLTRLGQLGIYVDEAHHIFGNKLKKDFDPKSLTSLRNTINELAVNLEEAGSKVVGCYNYTGTPYVGKRLLPEVVYAYGLKDAIDNKYLKKVKIFGIQNVKKQTKAFVQTAISEFWEKHKEKRYENMLPKFAFFASTIDELNKELRPIVEDVLSELNIPINKILVNVGDPKLTSNDDIREFKNLDSPSSDKQFILLVNKGKEGWNCRSLFGVGLHREPKSKVFVLQATMRCLRSISDIQQTGLIYLAHENISILENELEANYRVSLEDITSAGDDKKTVEVRPVPPPIKIKLKRIKKLHNLKEKVPQENTDLELSKIDKEKYKILMSERSIANISKKIGADEDLSELMENRIFSEITLVAEIARYLNRSCIEIRQVLKTSKEGLPKLIEVVNEYNDILYDWIIPRLFNELYDLIEFKSEEIDEVELVKEPKDDDCYRVKSTDDLTANCESERYSKFKSKSFHLDNYCFDSNPESKMFWTLINDGKLEKVWFTGMLTHGQSDFLIRYIDPDSHTVRSYFPDFLVKVKTEDNTDKYIILEVKGDNKIDDNVVKAKAEYASQLAHASGMTYQIIKGSEAEKGVGIKL